MAADCAHELKKSNVAMVSLWPGPVKTEFITENVIQKPKGNIMKKMSPLTPISTLLDLETDFNFFLNL